jgi:hypothetical protein
MRPVTADPTHDTCCLSVQRETRRERRVAYRTGGIPMSVILFGILLPCLVVGLGCWLGYQLVRQKGRLLVRRETLDQRLGQLSQPAGDPLAPPPLRSASLWVPPPRPAVPPSPEGLPLDSFAPDFTLPALDGESLFREQFRQFRW